MKPDQKGKSQHFTGKPEKNVSVYKIYVSIYNFVFEKQKKCGILQIREDIPEVSEKGSGKIPEASRKAKQEIKTGNDPHRKGEY